MVGLAVDEKRSRGVSVCSGWDVCVGCGASVPTQGRQKEVDKTGQSPCITSYWVDHNQRSASVRVQRVCVCLP